MYANLLVIHLFAGTLRFCAATDMVRSFLQPDSECEVTEDLSIECPSSEGCEGDGGVDGDQPPVTDEDFVWALPAVAAADTTPAPLPSWRGTRGLETESHATLNAWSRVELGGDACPSCVAVLQRRLRHDASDLPSEQRSRWEQKLRLVTHAEWGCEPRQPCSVTQQGRWQRPTSRSGGKRRPSDQAGPQEST